MKIDERSLNPNNTKQARLFYCYDKASDAGEDRNATIVLQELSERLGFKRIGAVPQTMAYGWDFWIEFENGSPELPDYFMFGVPWEHIGSA